jgi:superfamily II DNA or RNA helicase
MPVNIIVREEVYIKGLNLPLIEAFKADNTFPNPKRAMLERLGKWVGREPIYIYLWKSSGEWLALPRGYLDNAVDLIRKYGLEYEIEDRTILPAMAPVEITGELRDYQESSVRKLLLKDTGVMEAPTGSGKTNCLLSVAADLQTPSLIVVHTGELLRQTVDRCKSWLGYDAGIIGGGKYNVKDITVGMIQSLIRLDVKEKGLYNRFGCLLLDECFPAGTIVNGAPIESIAVGDRVLSFDPDTGQVLLKNVVRTFRNPSPDVLIRLSFRGTALVCTGNHRIFTKHGWVESEDLTVGEEVLSYEGDYSSVSLVRNNHYACNETPERSVPQSREGVLLQRTCSSIEAEHIVQNHGCNKQKIRLGEDEGKQSDVSPGYPTEIKRNPQKNEMETYDSGRQWPANPGNGKDIGGSIGVERDNSPYRNQKEEQPNALPGPLQDRFGGSISEDSNRDRWPLPLQPEIPRCEERKILNWARVDCIEVFKQHGDATFGGLCPGGFVYNLEVEDTHTYFANSIGVKNCHHAPALTYAELLRRMPCRYKYGFTATAWRKDKQEFIIWRMIGPITAKISNREVQDAGKLVWPTVEYVPTEYFYEIDDTSQWVFMISDLVADGPRNYLIVRNVRSRLRDDPATRALILTDRIDHANTLGAMMPELQPVILTGEISKTERATRMAMIRSGARLTIATIHLLGEGIDVPGWGLLFLVSPLSGGTRTVQALGRITRPAPGKDRSVLVDFVDERVHMLKMAARARKRLYQSTR